MNLNQTILDAARDEVAKEYGFNEWSMMMYSLGEDDIQHLSRMSKRAALLAMEKQAEFFRHIFFIGWRVVDNIDGEPIYEQGKQGPQQTELELYNIWREATTQQ